MGRGGLAFRTLDRGIVAAYPLALPLYISSTGLLLPHYGSWTFPCVSSTSSLHLLVRYFWTNRAGSSNTHWRRQYSVRYGKTRHRPIHCRRSKRLRGEDAVPCGSLRLLMKSAHRRRLLHRRIRSQSQASVLSSKSPDGTWGSCLPDSGPKIVAACPFAPPAYGSSTGPPLPQSVSDLSFREFLIFSPPPCSMFSDEPGMCLKHRRRQYPVRYG